MSQRVGHYHASPQVLSPNPQDIVTPLPQIFNAFIVAKSRKSQFLWTFRQFPTLVFLLDHSSS